MRPNGLKIWLLIPLDIRVHISWAEVTPPPPSQVCRFLDLEIDSNEMEIKVTPG